MMYSINTLICALGLLLCNAVSAESSESKKHPEAEEALERTAVLAKNYNGLTFENRSVYTTTENESAPGFHGLVHMSWKGETNKYGSAVATVMWFDNVEAIVSFLQKNSSTKHFRLGEYDGAPIWEFSIAGYAWTDGEHYFVSLMCSPTLPVEMLNDWLEVIPNHVAKVKEEVAIEDSSTQ